MTNPRSLPRTADNLLLAADGDGTRAEFRGVVKDYGTNRVLHGVDLVVHSAKPEREPRTSG